MKHKCHNRNNKKRKGYSLHQRRRVQNESIRCQTNAANSVLEPNFFFVPNTVRLGLSSMRNANVASFSIKHSFTIGSKFKHAKNGRPNKIQENERMWQKGIAQFRSFFCARRVLLGFGSKVMATQQKKNGNYSVTFSMDFVFGYGGCTWESMVMV